MKPCKPQRRDLPALTGLRFIAACSILFNHLLLGSLPAAVYPGLAPMLRGCGLLGMDIFFILSGFIIHYNYSCKLQTFSLKATLEFASARISRLYPLFIFFFFFDFFTSNFVFSHFTFQDILQSLPFFLTLTQTWAYFKIGTGALVAYSLPNASITWSISTEMFLYCSFPCILWLLLRDTMSIKGRIWLFVLTTVLVSFGLRLLFSAAPSLEKLGVALFGPQAGAAGGSAYSFAYWLAFLAPYSRVFEFLLGVLCSHLFFSLEKQEPSPREERLVGLLALGAVGTVLTTFLPDAWRPTVVDAAFNLVGYCIPIVILVFTCTRYERIPTTRLFCRPKLVNWGERSYSIYLLHIFMYGCFPPPNPAIARDFMPIRAVALISCVIFMARFFYEYIEMPCRKALRAACNRRISILIDQ